MANEVWRCPHCDNEVDAGEAACPACGRLREPAQCERHPDRKAEGQCAICGTPVCDECNSGGAGAYLCPAHAEVSVISGWAQVYSTSDDIEAQLIAENLQAEGLQAQVLSQKDSAIAVDLGEFSQVRVLVPAWEYAEAERVIASHMDAAGEVSFACPNCGEPYEPGQKACEACGHALPGAVEQGGGMR